MLRERDGDGSADRDAAPRRESNRTDQHNRTTRLRFGLQERDDDGRVNGAREIAQTLRDRERVCLDPRT